jgi:hypothetical protein
MIYHPSGKRAQVLMEYADYLVVDCETARSAGSKRPH